MIPDEDKTKIQLIEELKTLRQQHVQLASTNTVIGNTLKKQEAIIRVGTWRFNPSRNEMLWSDGLYLIYGLSPDDVQTSLLEKSQQVVHPDDRQLVATFCEASIAAKKPFQVKYRIIQQGGSERNVLTKGAIVCDKKGDVEEVIGTVQDITEQQRNEDIINESRDRLHSLLQALPDYVFIIDEQGRIIEYLLTDEMADVMYKSPQDKAKGEQIQTLFQKEHADLIMQTIEKTIKTKQLQTAEYILQLPEGPSWFEGRASYFRLYSGMDAVVWATREITQRKLLEAQLRQSQKMEAIGKLTGGVAHEFNNLLAPIVGYAQMLTADKPKDHPDTNSLNRIQIAANRASELVQQMLAYGRQSLSLKKQVHLARVIDDTLVLIQKTFPANIVFKKEIKSDVPAIWGMPNELHQVLLNLCINACQAMAGSGTLTISLNSVGVQAFTNSEGHKREGHFVQASVHDTGVGMDQATIDRIFDPFYTTKGVGEGSGLGLSVVQGIVEQHEGFIEVDSTLGEGCTIDVYFPLAQEESTTPAPKIEPLPQGNGTILLVDDEPMIIELTNEMLNALGYEVSAFLDCEAALQYFSEHSQRFDLVITDYGMPKMDGKEFAQKLKAIRPDIPVILFTGYGNLVAKENIHNWGMDALLLKPFKIKSLSEVVRSVLGA